MESVDLEVFLLICFFLYSVCACRIVLTFFDNAAIPHLRVYITASKQLLNSSIGDRNQHFHSTTITLRKIYPGSFQWYEAIGVFLVGVSLTSDLCS